METNALQNAIQKLKEKDEKATQRRINELYTQYNRFIKETMENYGEIPDETEVAYFGEHEGFGITTDSNFISTHKEKLEEILFSYSAQLKYLREDRNVGFYTEVKQSQLKLQVTLYVGYGDVMFNMPDVNGIIFPRMHGQAIVMYFNCKDTLKIILANLPIK